MKEEYDKLRSDILKQLTTELIDKGLVIEYIDINRIGMSQEQSYCNPLPAIRAIRCGMVDIYGTKYHYKDLNLEDLLKVLELINDPNLKDKYKVSYEPYKYTEMMNKLCHEWKYYKTIPDNYVEIIEGAKQENMK